MKQFAGEYGQGQDLKFHRRSSQGIAFAEHAIQDMARKKWNMDTADNQLTILIKGQLEDVQRLDENLIVKATFEVSCSQVGALSVPWKTSCEL
jgi:hypothetical protein